MSRISSLGLTEGSLDRHVWADRLVVGFCFGLHLNSVAFGFRWLSLESSDIFLKHAALDKNPALSTH